jgi:hypothetical protein
MTPTFLDISEPESASERKDRPAMREDAAKEASYLLEEDEPPHGHVRMKVALLLLVIAIGLLAWHWRQDMRALLSGLHGGPNQTATSSSPDAASSASPDTAPSITPPAKAAPETPVPTESASSKTAKVPDASPAPAMSTADSASTGATAVDAPPAKNQETTTASSAAPNPETSNETANTVTASDAPAPPPVVKVVKPKPEATSASAVPASPGAALAAQGEKYLYGTGVPPDCDRARKSLLAAAQQSNSHAQSVLGTMYTTGHCEGRDLPTAYRWFAKALHGDPNNQRLVDDLESLWRQMTPGEKQAALQK